MTVIVNGLYSSQAVARAKFFGVSKRCSDSLGLILKRSHSFDIFTEGKTKRKSVRGRGSSVIQLSSICHHWIMEHIDHEVDRALANNVVKGDAVALLHKLNYDPDQREIAVKVCALAELMKAVACGQLNPFAYPAFQHPRLRQSIARVLRTLLYQ